MALDLRNLKPGDICGFGTLGKFNGHITITCEEQGKLSLGMRVIEDTGRGLKTDERAAATPIKAASIVLRTEMDFETHRGICAYSLDGKTWQSLGGEFTLAYDWRTGTFQGVQFAIFCYNAEPSEGFVDVDSFVFSDQRPAQPLSPVAFERFEYNTEQVNAESPLAAGQHRNLILAGFHLDPSV